MNCPPDYICNATPAWVMVAVFIGIFLFLVLLFAVAWIGDHK